MHGFFYLHILKSKSLPILQIIAKSIQVLIKSDVSNWSTWSFVLARQDPNPTFDAAAWAHALLHTLILFDGCWHYRIKQIPNKSNNICFVHIGRG